MIEVFLAWWKFWDSYWVLMYSTGVVLCIYLFIIFTISGLLAKIWGPGRGSVVSELRKIREQLEKMNK